MGILASFLNPLVVGASKLLDPAVPKMGILASFLHPLVVGASKLLDTAGGDIIRELVVWLRSVTFGFCAMTGDRCNGDAVSSLVTESAGRFHAKHTTYSGSGTSGMSLEA